MQSDLAEERFQEIYQQPTRGWGALFLDRWYAWAIRSRLEPIKHAARSIKRHREGILAWFDSHIANGLIEGINSLVQAAKAKARIQHRVKRGLAAEAQAAAAHRRVVNSPFERFQHLDDQVDYRFRRVVLTALLAFGECELSKEVFVDVAKDVFGV